MKLYQRILSIALCVSLMFSFTVPSMVVSAEEEKLTGEAGRIGTTTGSKTGLTYKQKFTEDWEGGLDLTKWSVKTLEDGYKSDFQVIDDPLGGTNEDGTPNQVMTYSYKHSWLVPTDAYWPIDGMLAGEMSQIKMRVYLKDFYVQIPTSSPTANNEPGMVWSYTSPDKVCGFQFGSNWEGNESIYGLVAAPTMWNEGYKNYYMNSYLIKNGFYGQGFVTNEWFDVTISINAGKVTFTAEDKNGVVCSSRAEAAVLEGGRFAIGSYRANRKNWNEKQTNGVMYIDDIEITFSQSTVDVDDVQKDVTAYYAGNVFLNPGDTLNITGEDLGKTVASAKIKKIDVAKTAGTDSAFYVNENTYDKAAKANVRWEDIPYEAGSLIEDFKIEQRSEVGIKMILPSEGVYQEKGSYAVLLEAAAPDGKDAVIIVNNPEISLLLQDDGDYATSNGWIKLSGYNLSVQNDDSKVSAILIDSQRNKTFVDNSQIEVDTTANNGASNDYYMMIHLDGLTPGKYQVMVHNGLGGNYGWSMPFDFVVKEKAANEIWREKGIFNVRDYGAVGDSLTNDTAAIQTAINAATENGGGTVYFPRLKNGEAAGYRITHPLRVGRDVCLKGDGSDMSFVFYEGYLDTEKQEYFVRFEGNVEISGLQLACQTNPFNHAVKRNTTPSNTSESKIYFDDAYIFIDTTGCISDAAGVVMEGYTHATAYTYLTEVWTGTHQYFYFGEGQRETYFKCVDSTARIHPRLSNKAANMFVNVDYCYFDNWDDGTGINSWSHIRCFETGFFENGSIGSFCGRMHYRNVENHNNTNNNRELFLTDGGVQGNNIKMQPLIKSYTTEEFQIIMEEELSKLSTEAEKDKLLGEVMAFVNAHPGEVYRMLNYTPKEEGTIYVLAGQGVGQARKITNVNKIGNYTYFTIEEAFAIVPNRSSLVGYATRAMNNTIVNNGDFSNGTMVGPYGHFANVTFDKITMERANSGVTFIPAYEGFMWYCSAKNIHATSIRSMRTEHLYTGDPAGMTNKSTMQALQFLGIRYCNSFIGENGLMAINKGGGTLPVNNSDVVFEHIDILNPESITTVGQTDNMQGIWLRDIVQYMQEEDVEGYSRVTPYTTEALKNIKIGMGASVYGTPKVWCDSVNINATRQRGDVNNDGMITLKDVTLVRQLLGEEISAEALDTTYGKDTTTVYADMSNDGVVDARDIYALRNYIRTGQVGDVGSSGTGGTPEPEQPQPEQPGTGGGEEPEPEVPEIPDANVVKDEIVLDYSKTEEED